MRPMGLCRRYYQPARTPTHKDLYLATACALHTEQERVPSEERILAIFATLAVRDVFRHGQSPLGIAAVC